MDDMKTSNAFLHTFDHEAIQENDSGGKVYMTGKYQVAYDHEDGKVYDIYVNTGLDCPQIWETVDLYSQELFGACEEHLINEEVK